MSKLTRRFALDSKGKKVYIGSSVYFKNNIYFEIHHKTDTNKIVNLLNIFHVLALSLLILSLL